ncbi:MAG: hypothetical protein KME41_03630 [Candidatus Thiodiazotropha sp. (ex Lucina pensylvanica)]|nr:hypothetical protein [Candidatus Thiodiazotropha sp. (ex Lucina pensylvanica)]MBT3033278.1 hypothetical protein [Candidatus Thiodiazotropha sp. (ex Lucina pensylvanica)]MBT3050963.1 hypothetical protein [Candidatus Thiodiazotropha sp. (ex Codakia orbicularis)]MBV2119497.1 hypothetical protein [Candidatus Thiodiazotropha sp. (ex Lucina aurantia)]
MDRDREVISMVAWCLMVMGLLMPWGVVSASEALPTAGDAERGAILDCVSSSVGVDGYERFDALMASQRAVGCRAERSGSATGEQKRLPLMVSPPVERAGDVERVPAQ